jgi:hypothetical protein
MWSIEAISLDGDTYWGFSHGFDSAAVRPYTLPVIYITCGLKKRSAGNDVCRLIDTTIFHIPRLDEG